MSITITRPLPLHCQQAIHCHCHRDVHHCHAANDPPIAVTVPISRSSPLQLQHSSPSPVHCHCIANKQSIAVAIATSITFEPSISVAMEPLHCHHAVLKPSITIRQDIHRHCPSQHPSPSCHPSPSRCSIAFTLPLPCPQAFHHPHAADNPFIVVALPTHRSSSSLLQHPSPLHVHYRRVAI
jgi:hypothetical protein